MKYHENPLFLEGIGLVAFLAKPKRTTQLKKKQRNNKPNKQRQTRKRATRNNQRRINNAPTWLPGGGVGGSGGGSGSSWAQGRRQEPPKISFGGLRGPKTIPGPRPGRPKRNFQARFRPPQSVHPPCGGGGGSAVLRPCISEHFPSKALLAPARGAKIKISGFWGVALERS